VAGFGFRGRAADLAEKTVRKLPSPKPSYSAFCSPSGAVINTRLDIAVEACIERALISTWESSRRGILDSKPVWASRDLGILLAAKPSLSDRATVDVSLYGSILNGIFSLLSVDESAKPRYGEASHPKSFAGNILIGVRGALGARVLRRALPSACPISYLELGLILYRYTVSITKL